MNEGNETTQHNGEYAMPECRMCGVALAAHELSLCSACWDATEDDESMVDLGGGMVVPLRELLEDD